MKRTLFLSIITITFSTISLGAERKMFSAIGKGEEGVIVSVKKISEKNGTVSSLFEITEKSKKEIKLPEEIREREIVGIFSSKKRLYVLSQLTNEQGDNPLLYENNNNKWSKIKEIDCKNFSKIEIQKSEMTVFCELEDEHKTTKSTNTINIKNLNVEKKLTIPTLEIKDEKVNAKLEGIPYEWDKIKIQNLQSKDYNINDF